MMGLLVRVVKFPGIYSSGNISKLGMEINSNHKNVLRNQFGKIPM